jgi:hypothetical protein
LAQAQAADQISWALLDKLKAKAKAKAQELKSKYLGGGAQPQSAAQQDAEVAHYILSEIAAGDEKFLKALGKIAKTAIKFTPVGAQVDDDEEEDEIDAQIKAEVSSQFWEKIKALFAKKQQPQSAAQLAAIDNLLQAEIANYVYAQGEGIFSDLKKKVAGAAKGAIKKQAAKYGLAAQTGDEP